MIEGTLIKKGTSIKINACGMIGSKRAKSDGCTLFGCQDENENINDYVIPPGDPGIGKRHLVIKYNIDNKSYYLRDLGYGSGTFVRLDSPLVLAYCVTLLDPETWLHHLVWRIPHGDIILHRF